MGIFSENISDDEAALKFAAIFFSSEDAIINKTLEGFITTWNPAAEKIFGYTESEILGKHITTIIPHDRLPEEDMIISKIKQGERVEHFETIRRTKEGKPVNVAITVTPIKNASGEIVGVSKLARDISDQIAARQKSAMLAAIVNSSEDAIISKNLKGFITSWNKGAENIFGYTEEEMIGKHITTIIPPERQQEETMIISKIVRGERVEHFDTRRLKKNGEQIDLSITVSPIKKEDGEIIGASKIARDISDKVLAAQQLKSYAEELSKLNQYKDEFISIASHELNTPLTSLKGFLQLVEREIEQSNGNGNPGTQSTYIKKALNLSNKLSRLIKDLLDVSKIESGKLQLQVSEFNLSHLIAEVVDNMRAGHKQHEIIFQNFTQPVFVTGDKDRLEQVFINLLANAIKYSPASRQVIVSAVKCPDRVLIHFQDFGIGIPEHQLSKLFTRFFRAAGVAHNFAGLGIGLYISKEIISRHSGDIIVNSQQGKGSTFTVVLPQPVILS